MHSRVFALLIVLVLSWVGLPAQAQAYAPVQSALVDAPAQAVVQADGSGVLDGVPDDPDATVPGETPLPAPSQAETVADLPVVIHHGADAPPSPGTMAPPGPYAAAAWRSAWLDGLQRPPCAAASAA